MAHFSSSPKPCVHSTQTFHHSTDLQGHTPENLGNILSERPQSFPIFPLIFCCAFSKSHSPDRVLVTQCSLSDTHLSYLRPPSTTEEIQPGRTTWVVAGSPPTEVFLWIDCPSWIKIFTFWSVPGVFSNISYQVLCTCQSSSDQERGICAEEKHSVIWQLKLHSQKEWIPKNFHVPLSQVSMLTRIDSEGRSKKRKKGQHGSSIPTSVSVPFKSSKLFQSVMKLEKQRDKKPFLGKEDQKASKMANS